MTVAVTVFDRGTLELECLEIPERGAGELDVAIETAAICGSDMHTVLGRRAAPERVALGHEGVGRVLDADQDATDLHGKAIRPGDRLVFALFSACGTCDRCAAGLAMKCRSLTKYGHESVATYPHATGTLANQIRLLPGTPVLRITDDAPDQRVVSAGCAVATASAIVHAAGTIVPDQPVLIFGAGALGLYAAAMLVSKGSEVYVTDPVDARLASVRRLGARPVRPDQPTHTAFPLVVEASGSASAFTNALDTLDIGGRLVAAGSVSLGSSEVGFDPALLVTRRLTVVGVHNYSAEEFAVGVHWLTTHGPEFDLDELMSEPVPLKRVRDAFDQMRAGRYPRVLVRP